MKKVPKFVKQSKMAKCIKKIYEKNCKNKGVWA